MNEKITILYVDDEPVNLTIFRINFGKKYNVIICDAGSKGLEILKSTPEIKVVISDMKMPEMTGIQFIKKAKSDFPHIAYYILTGFDINDEIADALDEKLINNYFNKPFNMKEIDLTIQSLII